MLPGAGWAGPRGATPERARAGDGFVHWKGLRHNSRDPLYRSPGGAVTAGTSVDVRFRTFHADVTDVRVRIWDVNDQAEQILPMTLAAEGVSCRQKGIHSSCDFWSITLSRQTPDNLWYRFIVTDGADTDYYADDTPALDGGLGAPSDNVIDDSYALMFYDPAYRTPGWLRHAVIYQIFPDRFRNGDPTNDPRTGDARYDDPVLALPWGTKPEGYCRGYDDASKNCPWRFKPHGDGKIEQPRGRDYMGGDLRGVTDELPYLRTLGVNTIYLNPVFDSASNHGYDTQDYFAIDPYFGSTQDWVDLVSAARKLRIRIILDGVFNHVSSDSPLFDRYRRFGTLGACESASSTYRSWFSFRPPRQGEPSPCEPSSPGGQDTYYESWAGNDSLPVLAKDNPDVQTYFLTGSDSVSAHWLRGGASGWRLDVMGDDSFPDGYWESFRTVVKQIDPDAAIIGEFWRKDSTLLRFLRGDRADTTMNYRLREDIVGLLAPGPFDPEGPDSGHPLAPTAFASRLESIQEDYPPAAFDSAMNLLDSHDTERLLWTLTPGAQTTAAKEENKRHVREGKRRLRLASLIQICLPGAPTVYYGDEVGVTGDKDPDDRRTYPWADQGGSPDMRLFHHYASLAAIRASHSSLTAGDLRVLLADDADGAVAIGRRTGSQAAIVAVNTSSLARTVSVPVRGYLPDGTVLDLVYGVANPSGGSVTVQNGHVSLTLRPLSGLLAITGTVDLTPPAAPADLRVTGTGGGIVSLAWDPVPGASGYDVFASPFAGGGYRKVNAKPVLGTTATVPRRLDGTTVHFVVRAADRAGNESGNSNDVRVT
jgi:glycosidase